ncbi:MAG TPA: AAA family ATPase [Kofleriaceae bacterium]|nr:AAA family ATPase [Kofleriaceae bacterium]
MKPAKHPSRRHTDVFTISGGGLGPVPACELSIRPLTVFVGAQGTGKSLVAQTLYAFEELPYLMGAASAERGAQRRSSNELFGSILDRLRSTERRFGTFANRSASVTWQRAPLSGEGPAADEWPRGAAGKLGFRASSATGQVTVTKPMRQFLDALRKGATKGEASRRPAPLHHALFFPTERMTIAQLRSAMSAGVLALPSTFWLFTHWMDDHAAPAVARWRRGEPDTAEGKLVERIGMEALRGRARKHGEQWKWQFQGGRGRRQLDLDMASSGQRANWSLPYLASALFSLRGTGDIADSLTVFVEEPEIHLHPFAQRKMVEILALLVRSGFRVVVTTHSITVLYALNNLVQAGRLPDDDRAPELPPVGLRLAAEDVSVYAFAEGKAPRQLMDVETAFISEAELGRVDEELSAEMNVVAAHLDRAE